MMALRALGRRSPRRGHAEQRKDCGGHVGVAARRESLKPRRIPAAGRSACCACRTASGCMHPLSRHPVCWHLRNRAAHSGSALGRRPAAQRRYPDAAGVSMLAAESETSLRSRSGKDHTREIGFLRGTRTSARWFACRRPTTYKANRVPPFAATMTLPSSATPWKFLEGSKSRVVQQRCRVDRPGRSSKKTR